jgi:hypothetical protein
MAIIKWIIAFRVVRKLPKRGRSRANRFASAWSRCSSSPGERESGQQQQQQDPSEADDGSMEGDAMKWDMGVLLRMEIEHMTEQFTSLAA